MRIQLAHRQHSALKQLGVRSVSPVKSMPVDSPASFKRDPTRDAGVPPLGMPSSGASGRNMKGFQDIWVSILATWEASWSLRSPM